MNERALGRGLLAGSASIAVGLVFAGGGSVAMLAMTARALRPVEYAAFAVWWTVATLLATAFGVFEAYLARLVVTEVAAHRDPRPVSGQVLGRAQLMALALGAGSLLASPVLARSLFHGHLPLALLLAVFVLLGALQSVQRGAATGLALYRTVALQLTTDGLLRAGITGGLIATGVRDPAAFAAGACVAALVSLVVADRGSSVWRARPRRRGPVRTFRPVALLLVGAVGPLLANSGSAPWLAAFGDQSARTVGAFVGALTLSRVPSQFIAAAFGPLMTSLSHAIEADDVEGFQRLQRKADRATALVCLAFVAAFGLLGPRVLRVYLGEGFRLSSWVMVLLAAASGLMLSAVVRQAGLAARGQWNEIALAWSLGAVAMGSVLLLPIPALTRAAGAPVAAVAVALAVLVWRATPLPHNEKDAVRP